MLKYGLCSNCRTGAETYKLDNKEPMCPHLYCYNGRKCLYYKPISKKFRWSILSKILKK